MTVLALKTELDVAELLLAEGWLPEEINGILVFPLPRAAFHYVSDENSQQYGSDVIKATTVTPTTFYRARQLLQSAGWLDRELESLLKPCLHDPWADQTTHRLESHSDYPLITHPLGWGKLPMPTLPLGHYRCTMALKRFVSLAVVITLVVTTVVLFG
ncbi:MAG: hypothetical protein AAF572_20265 [Cyanobacteria bacterium P01_B01_bin.77]